MAYDGTDNYKFTPEDFASIEAIDEWWPIYTEKYTENNNQRVTDSDGYTPLGAAILNSAPLECIAHIMELYTFNKPKTTNAANNPFIDVDNDISKGRSPIGVACLAMNADAVDVLRSQYYEYILKDEDGNPIPKLDHYGDPINAEKYVMYTSVPLWNDYTKEEYKYNRLQKLSEQYENIPLKYKACEDTDADWLAAAALPKADILIKLIPEVSPGADKPNYNDITDDNGNTLILLACVADCHESVVHIRDNCSNFNRISTKDSSNPDQIFIKNGDDLTAFDVALESQDTDLLPLLLKGQDISDLIDQLLREYFSEKANKKINKILITLVTADNIYNYYIKVPKYDYGISGDPAYKQYYIIEYIEKENKTSLFNLLLQKYNDPSDADPPIYKEHLTNFFENMCKRIIAFLYRKSYIPFNKNTATDKLNALLDFYNGSNDNAKTLYAEIVKLLFDSNDVSLQLICDISNKPKRDICIDKIFTGEYNKWLFIQLLKVISNNTDDILDQYTDILINLYNGGSGYFRIQHIAELQHDLDLNKTDEFLWNTVYILVGHDIANIELGINSTHRAFGIDCCIYLYKNNKITINDIVGAECTPEFKRDIINPIYNDESLKLEDIYYIYKYYNNTLSAIHKDLKPFIGCMKYIQEDSVVTSDFFWAYDFTKHTSTNWHSPQNSYVDIPPITDGDLVDVNSSSPRYKQVKIVDATGSVGPKTPNEFRLDVYNCKPEFYINSVYNATSNKNAMIVAFGSYINSINANISFNIPVQRNNELYSIVEDTYLDEQVKTINWVTTNSLYAALYNQQCYSKNSNELPAIDSIQFKNDQYTDIDVSLPASGDKITAIHGTHWSLPSVSGDTYTDSNTGIKYEPTGWKIGSDSRSFGYDYIFNETDATAQLEFTEAEVTLTYQKSYYDTLEDTLEFNLPNTEHVHSGDEITLASFDSQYYYTTSGIKYEAKNWIIGGQSYAAGTKYHIYDDAIAELKCDKASVTLTYTKPAELTLYNSSGNAVSWPSTVTRDSGTTITLATLSNTYYNADRTKTYTLTGWKIWSTNYSFGATYNLKDNTTAALQYAEVTITVGIICSVSSETITEGAHFTRTFKLSHQPTANVTLNISSTISGRLYIGNSVSSTTNSITLTFTASNWNNEQTVYFIAQDDNNVNGNASGTVSIQSSSTGDSRYNGLTRSFSIAVNDNDSAVVEHIGTPAFESGIFTVIFVENDDIIPQTASTGTTENETYNGNTIAHTKYTIDNLNIKNEWSNIYETYKVQQVPKSPYYGSGNSSKYFEYDRLYDDSLND